MRPRALNGLPWLSTLALSACATAASCHPVTVVVAAKQERTRIRAEPGGLMTTEMGYVREVHRDVLVREFWLKDLRGRWGRVSESTWRYAEIGKPAEVCQGQPMVDPRGSSPLLLTPLGTFATWRGPRQGGPTC